MPAGTWRPGTVSAPCETACLGGKASTLGSSPFATAGKCGFGGRVTVMVGFSIVCTLISLSCSEWDFVVGQDGQRLARPDFAERAIYEPANRIGFLPQPFTEAFAARRPDQRRTAGEAFEFRASVRAAIRRVVVVVAAERAIDVGLRAAGRKVPAGHLTGSKGAPHVGHG